MFLVIKKPSWGEARAAVRIIRTLGKETTARKIRSGDFLVAVNEHQQVMAVVERGPKKTSYYALAIKAEQLVRKIVS